MARMTSATIQLPLDLSLSGARSIVQQNGGGGGGGGGQMMLPVRNGKLSEKTELPNVAREQPALPVSSLHPTTCCFEL